MKYCYIFIAVLMGLLSISVTEAASHTEIIGFRSGNHPTHTRIVFDINVKNKASYKAFTLFEPHRLVVDINHGAMSKNLKTQLNNYHFPLFKKIRIGQYKKDNLRIVFELNEAKVIRDAFIIPAANNKPLRLVIDLGVLPKDSAPIPHTKSTQTTPTHTIVRKPLIVIDAGHGGRDPGAIGVRKTKEKQLTLAYAKTLRTALLNTGKYRVLLTRDKDFFIPLQGRVDIARRRKGDMFISIHANSHKKRRTRGFSIYTLSEVSSDKEAAALARKENAAGIIEGVDLSVENNEIKSILIDLAQRQTKNQSAQLAELMVEAMHGHIPVLKNPHRFAGFRVLKAPDIPAVLAEIGYVTNKKEEYQLKRKSYREKMINRMVVAINRYFQMVN